MYISIVHCAQATSQAFLRDYPPPSLLFSSQAILPCLKELWSSPQLTNLSPKVVELLISTIRHFYSSEKVYT